MAKANLIVAALYLAAVSASAGVITTNSGFLGTYTGPQNQDLNVMTAQVSLIGSNLVFTSTLGAAVGTTTGVDYIWGVDRGLLANEALFGASAPGVLFDAVVILSDSGGVGSGFVDDIAGGGTVTNLAAGAVTITGSTITGTVPISLLASNVLSPGQYGVNLWPSLGIPGPFSDIAEFAPSVNADASVTTPEPGSLILFSLGLIGIAARAHKSRRGETAGR
jgi:hypothetical protein